MDDFFWEEVERSRKLTPEQRFLRTLQMIPLPFSRSWNVVFIVSSNASGCLGLLSAVLRMP
jgi:hypothetical protein